ncbi:MAG: electron transfer flavoprotein subunit beta/FixA family protein [Bacteroidales bacterium]|nr:electron transfer flavoprotein subunit beta/FixA family protein [Bacteroidales bacterium]
MKILVCIGNVPDTTTKIKFTDNNSRFDDTGIQWIINPWDELALTRALELKEKSAGKIEKITVVNVGMKITEPTIRKALAIGADDAIRIDAEPFDSYFVASQIAIVAKDFNLILSGLESSDYNGAAMPGMLAELLGMASVSAISGIDLDGDQLKFVREIDGGNEKLTVKLPVVAVVQKGIASAPRIPAMRGIMMARKKPLNVIAATDTEALTECLSFELPPKKAACRMVDEENAGDLIGLLKNEAKVL